MADRSSIEWTHATWNPVTGCKKVSAGCLNCYAERLAKRLQAMGNRKYCKGFNVAVHPESLDCPKRWRSQRLVFVNSMSDLFLPEIPFHFVRSVFRVMNDCSRHVFQILTKRPQVAAECAEHLEWTDNIWMGVTVEDESVTERITCLRDIPARVRFLSLEPLLTRIPRLPLEQIDWVIVGGESGPDARNMDAAWVREVRDRCLDCRVPFFFKQWGGPNKKKAGRSLDGRTWDGMPDAYPSSMGQHVR